MLAKNVFGAACFEVILYRTLVMFCASGISFTVGPSLVNSRPAQRDAQPLTKMVRALCLRNRLTAFRLLDMARDVTAQLWTTARSAVSDRLAARRPSRSSSSDICWASYWFTLHPITSMWYVFTVDQFRLDLGSGQSASAGFERS